jgi:hypothetical protein
VTRRAKAALIGLAVLIVLIAVTPIGCAVRKRVYVSDNMELLNSLPAYPGTRVVRTERESEYRGPDDNELSPPEGWSSHRVYAVPLGVRMSQVLEFYERELTRRGWRRQRPDCGDGFEKGEATILVNAGPVNARDPNSSYDIGVDAHGADEC